MTYIIGWKNSRSVFLSGDSIVETNFKMRPDEKQTSFGEELIKTNEFSLSEKCLKIWVIKNLVIGFASCDVYEAIEFLDLLNTTFDQSKIEESINQTIKQFTPKYSEFLFVFHENNENKLLRYNADYDELIPENEPTQIGSLPEGYQDQSYEFCAHLSEKEKELNDYDSLTLINGIHQNILSTQGALEKSVGGIFTGLFLNQNGIFWQKDTIYINYSGDLNELNNEGTNLKDVYSPTGMTHLIIRNNCASFTSGMNKTRTAKTDHLFRCWESKNESNPPAYIKKEKLEWQKRFEDQIFKLFDCPTPTFICLFSNKFEFAGNLILIRSYNGNPYVKISCLENNEFEIGVNMSIIKALNPLEDSDVYNYRVIN